MEQTTILFNLILLYMLFQQDSDLGKVINRAKIGVVWHTTYTGSALQDMKASFGANISKLTKTSTVWMDDATYKDTSGTATFTSGENAEVTSHLSNAGKSFHQINSAKLRKFLEPTELTDR